MYSFARGVSRSGAKVQYSSADVSSMTTPTGSRVIPFSRRRQIGILVKHKLPCHIAKDLADIARTLVKEVLHAENGVISVQVLSEFWVTVTRKIQRPLSFSIARQQVELFGLMTVVDLDFALFYDALRLQQLYQIAYRDAQHVAGFEIEKAEPLVQAWWCSSNSGHRWGSTG